jgi:hypothetical protein
MTYEQELHTVRAEGLNAMYRMALAVGDREALEMIAREVKRRVNRRVW